MLKYLERLPLNFERADLIRDVRVQEIKLVIKVLREVTIEL